MASQYDPVTLPNTQTRPLESAVVGETYQLFISLPATYAHSDRRYPVVYLTDGNGLFPLVRSIAEGLSGGLEIPRLIIVGIGYVSDEQAGRYRERDLLPTDASPRNASQRQPFTRSGIPRGRAELFLSFIREELKPFVEAEYRARPEGSTYAGASYGGLFGLYVLFHQPDTFDHYIIGSPAIHHDDRVIMTYESDYAARHDDLKARVFLSVGAREESEDPLIEPRYQFVSNVCRLGQILGGAPLRQSGAHHPRV
jgi:predicted alpha/beta superfamily hydrolase